MSTADLNTSDQLAILEEYIEKNFLKTCDILSIVKEQHAAVMELNNLKSIEKNFLKTCDILSIVKDQHAAVMELIDIKYTAILKEIQVCRYEIDIVKEMVEEKAGQEEEESADSQSEGEDNACTEEPPLTQYANGEEEIYVIPKKRRLNPEKKS
jgi:hypothetical protein